MFVLIPISFFGILMLFSHSGADTFERGAESSDGLTAKNSTSEEAASLDSDGDGLPDWEEALWGTDPHARDSDRDGVPDGKEVASRTTTAIGVINSSASSAPGLSAPDTATEQLARQVLAQYADSRQGLPPPTSEEIAGTIQTLLDTTTVSVGGTTYSAANARQVPDSTETWRAYANALGALIVKYAGETGGLETNILSEALTNGTPDTLAELKPIIDAYRGASSDMKRLSVPNSLTDQHVQIANSFEIFANTLEGMQKNLFQDPVTGLVYYSRYQKELDVLAASLQSVAEKYSQRGIFFTQGEPGNVVATLP